MPFSTALREEVLVRSRRCCCVCRKFAGRNVNVHHIILEAGGGSSTMENAIALCFDCHAEAGHYNPQHPLGAKYSPSELKRHRDEWWKICEAETHANPLLRCGDNTLTVPPIQAALEVVEREVGVLWSHLLNEPAHKEVMRFHGALIAETREEDANGPHWYELYRVPGTKFLVYHIHIHRGDYCRATLLGAWGEVDLPLSLEQLQDKYPALATRAGLPRVRVLEL